MLRWYLVHTKRAQEATAAAQLARQGFEIYLPRLAQPIRRRGRWQSRIEALFPAYLFLRVDEGKQALGPVRSTVGISHLVRFGSNYAIVPDRLIDALKSCEDPETGLHRLERPCLPAAGSHVRIFSGPFDGLEGVYERASGDDRVVVLLNLLGQNTRVYLPVEAILPGCAA